MPGTFLMNIKSVEEERKLSVIKPLLHSRHCDKLTKLSTGASDLREFRDSRKEHFFFLI